MINLQKVVRNQVEYRTDPLTSEQTRINPDRTKRVKQAESRIQLQEIINHSRNQCIFCPDRIDTITPDFPTQICPTGKIRRGETAIFPNLSPFAENHAVGVITSQHFLDVDQFTDELLTDNLMASLDYVRTANSQYRQAIYPAYIWNYMPPSAGSIIHQHVQIMVETEPIPGVKKYLQKSENYFNQYQENYWKILIEEEKRLGQRYIGGTDTLSLIASFAPRGMNEVQFIFHGISSLSDLTQKRTDDFVHCLRNILKGYKQLEVGAFNLGAYSGPMNQKQDYYWLNMKLISRPFPKGLYTNDTGPMERLYDAWVIDTLPESLPGLLG